MPQDLQALWNTLEFTSSLNTFFNLLAYFGLLIFTWGIIDKKRQAPIFLGSGIMVWSYAIFGQNPIFVATQSVMTVASFMRVRKVEDAPTVITFLTTLTFIGVLFLGLIDSNLQLLGLLAGLGLTLGVPLAQRLSGNLFFTVGGILMAWYAYLVWSLPFLVLNIIFTAAVIWELAHFKKQLA